MLGFKPLRLPALKRVIIFELFPATLKRCFPLLKQRAPTNLTDPGARWEPPHLWGGWSASALQNQDSTSILRFSAGESRFATFPHPVLAPEVSFLGSHANGSRDYSGALFLFFQHLSLG